MDHTAYGAPVAKKVIQVQDSSASEDGSKQPAVFQGLMQPAVLEGSVQPVLSEEPMQQQQAEQQQHVQRQWPVRLQPPLWVHAGAPDGDGPAG